MLFIALLILVGRFCWGRISYLISIFNWSVFVVQHYLNKNSVGVFFLLLRKTFLLNSCWTLVLRNSEIHEDNMKIPFVTQSDT